MEAHGSSARLSDMVWLIFPFLFQFFFHTTVEALLHQIELIVLMDE